MIAMGNPGWKYRLAYVAGVVLQAGLFYLIFYCWLGLPVIGVSETFLVLALLTTALYWSLYYVQKIPGYRRRLRWSMFLLWCSGVVGSGILFWWSATWTWKTFPINSLILAIAAVVCGGATWLAYRTAVNTKLGARSDDPDLQ